MTTSNLYKLFNKNVAATDHDENNNTLLNGNLQPPHNETDDGIEFGSNNNYYTMQKYYLGATTATRTLKHHDRLFVGYGDEKSDDTSNTLASMSPDKAIISLEQRRIFPRVDFVRRLPRELVYEIFCYINFLGFATCTHVSKAWRAILMNDVWARRFTSFCSAYPFNKLTPEEQRLIRHGLSRERQQRRGQEDTTTMVVIRAQTYDRTRALVAMGNCGLHAVDLNGSLDDAETVVRANQKTLKELNVSILMSSPSSLQSMYPILTAIASSKISKLCLTVPFNLSSSDRCPDGVENNSSTVEAQQQLMPLLVDIRINGYSSTELRLNVIRFFLTHCPYIKSLTAHPIIPRMPDIEEELNSIEKLAPVSLQTLIV
ncbi:hypothetical protein BDB00DRAFT_878820 [Zychaea mexicana]|uniref:uncharacterized protein n=1 Tax=Zychaea mexicana TaxID=64656 RepID=UPI0022FF0E5F|nr:uncharacterized protein BDB00DRAFT_878820 [Zychaea mexicana]KAI9484446.1 hypothetical protein BDB00DRAFT_878820 [Zychaea mexicana]